MPGNFISYRWDDSADITGRSDDRLVLKYGRSQIFRDVDSSPGGNHFKQRLEGALKDCEVVLVVIGPRC